VSNLYIKTIMCQDRLGTNIVFIYK
jgi:hypothetical protein